ncbi:MAG TPA: hypothetical protein VG326_02970 [Tepidisphaeraceae bacterium]|nr:hypothetical protein [Tepidisphaeraceae bacterium]
MAGVSWGQLPVSIVTSADPTPDRAVIEGFVDKCDAKLASPEYSAWASARSLIVGEATRQGATQGFLDLYADILNKRFLPLADAKDARQRLNVAIIVARVAAKANDGKLTPITEALLHDSSDAVVLWGLQSAKYIVPAWLQMGNAAEARKLAMEAAQAAKDHPTPATIEEVYRTLVLDPNFGTEKSSDAVLKTLSAKAITDYLPAPISFYQYRVNLYNGAVPPTQPVADTWGSSFFIKASVWSAETPQQQSQVLQAMLGLLKGAARQNAAAKSPEMFDLVKRTGQAFDVVGSLMKNSRLEKAAHNIASVPNDVPVDELDTRINALAEFIK